MDAMKNTCKGMEARLAEMLLDPEAAPEKVKAHVAACANCTRELAELQATMNLLDTWEAPEPSPYFMTRLDARMREERAAAPEGWLSRLRARLAFGPQMHVRPLAAMALSVMMLLGGGFYLGVNGWEQPEQPGPNAFVVHDLQTLDNNAQVLDQMEAMSTPNDDGQGQ
jgi:hypothetical protein